jgi:hypothetical protein
MERILWLLLLTNGVSALVGLAQVFYPATFMPELSSLALSLNPNAVKSMTYVGSLGQQIVRPPGLTDMPGGAAIGGLTSAFLGIVLGSRERQSMPLRFFCFGLATVGITVIYFSQIRSLLILLVLAITGMCVLLLRQTRFVQSAWIGGTCLLLLAVTFGWAVAVGGRSVFDRFTSITDVGLEQSFQQNRGIFIKQTVETLVAEYPFGAGVGRWGMMNVYFPGDSSQPAPIWVEIQMTGWLLDGGLLMWFLYGGAIMVSLFYLYRTTTSVVDPQLCHLASVVLCLNLFVFGLSFAGPAFNNQLGLQFWFLTAALYGVATRIVPVQIHANETPRMTVGNGTLPAGYSARIGE